MAPNRYGNIYMCISFNEKDPFVFGCVFCADTPGRQTRQGTRLCDGPPPPGSRLKTCDKRMCPDCATRPKPNHDLCPDCIGAARAARMK